MECKHRHPCALQRGKQRPRTSWSFVDVLLVSLVSSPKVYLQVAVATNIIQKQEHENKIHH